MPISTDEVKKVAARAECLFTNSEIQQKIDEIATEISLKLSAENPLVICVMTGGLIISSELLKRFNFPLELDYLHATRYGNNTAGESLQWLVKPRKDLKNRTVLIIDDILDVGKTLYEVIKYCENEGAKKIYTAVLVEKEHQRKEGLLNADFTAMQVPDRYVFGYGMDYKQYLRNTAGIYAAAKEDE